MTNFMGCSAVFTPNSQAITQPNVQSTSRRFGKHGPVSPHQYGCGEDITIRELSQLVAKVVGFEGEIVWDTSKPDGTPRKLLEVSRLKALGWESKIGLEAGIKSTYDWFWESGRINERSTVRL